MCLPRGLGSPTLVRGPFMGGRNTPGLSTIGVHPAVGVSLLSPLLHLIAATLLKRDRVWGAPTLSAFSFVESAPSK